MADEALQALVNDIVKGVRAKLVEPVVAESKKSSELISKLHGKEQKELEEIKARLERLEEAVLKTPLLLLAAINEAVNRIGTDDGK